MILKRRLAYLDVMLIFLMFCLIAIGTVAIHEATVNTKLNGLHVNNVLSFAVFCIPMAVLALLDYRFFIGKFAYVLYAIGIGLLLWVQFKGENLNGAVRWFQIGSYQIQPSELAKLFTVLLVAHLLHRRQGEKLRLFADIVPILAVFLIPFFLILKQPDLGTALVFIGILLGMMWMGNIRILYMLAFVAAAACLIGVTIWLFQTNPELLSKFVKPHQMNRIETFIDPTSDPDKAWHVKNAITAVGAGQLYGDDGYYLKHGFIPYAYSDSIFVVIGEQFGFLGSSALLLIYFILIYRMVIIVYASRDLAGSYLVVGLISMFVFQIFVNIGMHIGILPLTGISLPFISYGGSSLLTNMAAIGLALSVSVHKGIRVDMD